MDDIIRKKVDTFFSSYPKRSYPKDQIIIFSGESPDKVFYILTGKVRQYDISYRGNEVVVNIFAPPAFFPMTWAINKTPNKYFYKTEVDTEVRIAPPDEVVAFIKDNPDVMFNLLSRLYNGIEGVLSRTIYLMSGTAKTRVIYELIIEAHRFGTILSENKYELHITETDLAAHAGLTRETISRPGSLGACDDVANSNGTVKRTPDCFSIASVH